MFFGRVIKKPVSNIVIQQEELPIESNFDKKSKFDRYSEMVYIYFVCIKIWAESTYSRNSSIRGRIICAVTVLKEITKDELEWKRQTDNSWWKTTEFASNPPATLRALPIPPAKTLLPKPKSLNNKFNDISKNQTYTTIMITSQKQILYV